MLTKNWITLCGFFAIAVGLIAVTDSGAHPGGMMQKKAMMMQMMGKGDMGMMHCCGMMGAGQQKATEDYHKLTMECCQKDKVELCDMLKSDKPEERFVAALAIGEKGLPLTHELIGLLSDKNDPIRQAARRSLILASYHVNAMKQASRKSAARSYVDFGPVPNVNPAQQKKSIKAWTEWSAKSEKDLQKLEQMLESASSTMPITHTKHSLHKVN